MIKHIYSINFTAILQMNSYNELKIHENTNIYSLGFNNGIYNLQTKTLLNYTDNDYVSNHIKYDYIEYDINNQYIIEIEQFFNDIQQNTNIKSLLLCYTSSFLIGKNYDKKMMILLGQIDNYSKNIYIELLKLTFGDYFNTIKTTYNGIKNEYVNSLLHDKENLKILMLKEIKINVNVNENIKKTKYYSTFKYQPQFKVILNCNELPQELNMMDKAIQNRIILFDFTTFNNVSINHNKQFINNLHLYKNAFMWLLINKYYPTYCEIGLKKLINNCHE